MSIDWNKINHFSPDEFLRPDCLRKEMIEKLDRLRDLTGYSMFITSSFRDPAHNTAVGGVQDSAHCLAPDGKYSGVDLASEGWGGAGLFQVIRVAYHIGFNRIGIYPKHIHLDVEDRLPQQVMWVGKD